METSESEQVQADKRVDGRRGGMSIVMFVSGLVDSVAQFESTFRPDNTHILVFKEAEMGTRNHLH